MKHVFLYMLACLVLVEPATGNVLDDAKRLARPSLTLNHEVGLDGATRALLQGYPSNVRENVIKALKEALPLIDDSVMRYLEAVDSVVSQRLNQASCLATGVLKNAVDDAGAALSFGQRGATPFKDLEDMRNQALRRLHRDSPPQDFLSAHADILIKASATVCQSLSVGATRGAAEAFDYVEEANRRLAIWSLLKKRCTKPSLCAEGFRDRVDALIRSADERDAQAVSARARFDAVHWPVPERLFESFDPLRYDQALGEAAAIEHSLRLAKLVRETRAQLLFDQANARLARIRNDTGIGTGRLFGVLAARDNLRQLRAMRSSIVKRRDLLAKTPSDCREVSDMARAAGILDPLGLGATTQQLVADAANVAAQAESLHRESVADVADLDRTISDVEQRLHLLSNMRRIPN